MKNFTSAMDARKSEKSLQLEIEGKMFETYDQYKTGAELKAMANIPLNVDLYLKVIRPFKDELIENEKKVNLARPEIERFSVKEEYDFDFNEIKYRSHQKFVTGQQIFEIAGISEVHCLTLYQKLKNHDFEKISLSEKVDLSNAGIEHFITKESESSTYSLNGEHEMTDEKYLNANQILQFGAFDAKENYLIQVFDDGQTKSYAYIADEMIKMKCQGMVFITAKWLDIVDIEQYGKQCKEIPASHKFKIKVDKNYHVVESRFITQVQLIALEGHVNTANYDVYKFMNGNPKPVKIAIGETVDLTEKCLVRFVLMPKEQQDGKGLRRNFNLPDEDNETLNEIGLQWEAISQPAMWLIIYDYPIPEGYNVQHADVALLLPSSYPAAQIDMAHFHPPLQKNNAKGITATTTHIIDGKTFQQWSRHRKPGEWRPGIDCVATHLALVDNWLINDLNR